MKTQFGIIGCGGIAARFAKAIGLTDSAQLHAAAARDLSRAEDFAEKFGAKKAYGSYKELAADPQVEIVYISLIHNLHYEAAKLCVEHGKAVICEKPFFISEDEGLALQKLAKENKVLLMEAMWTRCLPAFQKAKEWAGSGSIGEIKYVDAAFCFRIPFNEETKTNRLYDPKTAGGALLDAGVYPYEFITGILGEKPSEIKAVAQKAPTGVDETVAMSLRFDSGVLASGVTSIGVRASDTAYVYGTSGYIKLYNFLGCRKCELYNDREELTECYEDAQEEGFVYEIEHVVQLYKNGQTESPLIPLQDSIDFARSAQIIREQCGLL